MCIYLVCVCVVCDVFVQECLHGLSLMISATVYSGGPQWYDPPPSFSAINKCVFTCLHVHLLVEGEKEWRGYLCFEKFCLRAGLWTLAYSELTQIYQGKSGLRSSDYLNCTRVNTVSCYVFI